MASGLYKVGCWFVGGRLFAWSFACLIAPVVTITIILRFSKIQNRDIPVPAYPVPLENDS